MASKETIGNFVWLDLEMTGLNPNNDVILEIASVITDGNLNVLEEGPAFIINQPKEKLAGMDKWCTDHHKKSGLTDAVLASTTTLQHAEEQTLAFIKKHCREKEGVLAGNSVWQDRNFLQKYMPSITTYLHYRLVDVTSIKVVAKKWYPGNKNVEFKKKDEHRSLADVYASIAELQNYREHFFI
jgi:oligoribonuclease